MDMFVALMGKRVNPYHLSCLPWTQNAAMLDCFCSRGCCLTSQRSRGGKAANEIIKIPQLLAQA